MMSELTGQISACRICADRFAKTATAHSPRPVAWFHRSARILVAGQAPGARVHESGKPFTDASGDRLRDWMGLEADTFYDRNKVAIVPMAFCFSGYDAHGSDLKPPAICAQTWRLSVMDALPDIRLTLLVGASAQRWHLGKQAPVGETVRDWRAHMPAVLPLPHPSWRNTGWIKKNPWFESDLLPDLRARIAEVLYD